MSDQVTLILDRIASGDANAAGELFPQVYEELRRRAAQYMSKERVDHTLQPTALVHEAYVRLIDGHPLAFQSRVHFYNAAAEAMRRILVDHARGRAAGKRGGGRARVDMEELETVAAATEGELDQEALDRALTALQAEDERPYRVVMLRYFAGLSEQDTAESLGISVKTVRRDWAAAKLFLLAEMEDSPRRSQDSD